jgi:hypothetical protein
MSNKGKANQRLRAKIEDRLKDAKVGMEIKTNEMKLYLSSTSRVYGLNNTRVGRLLGEFEKLRFERVGVFVVVE